MTAMQLDLEAKWRAPVPAEQDGETFDQSTDGARLNKQMWRVVDFMKPRMRDDCGKWFAPDTLESELGDNWAALGARLRDTRKEKFNCPWYAQRTKVGRGLFCYRLIRKDGPTYWTEILKLPAPDYRKAE